MPRIFLAALHLALTVSLAILLLVVLPAATAASDSTALSFGSNNNGRTGMGTTAGNTLVATPIDMTNLAGKSITQVAAGSSYSLLLADDGSVFSFGRNLYGQTGVNTADINILVATPIDTTNLAGRSITQIAAGDDHSLLLADDGSVFSFGTNGSGETGLNTRSGNTPLATPIDTTNLTGKSITQVAAGGGFSLLLADDGTVISLGNNNAGRTGQNTTDGHTLVATPIDTTNLAGKSIIQVAAGSLHSLLLADDESVFSFGRNYYGRTGLNTLAGNTVVAMPIDTTHLTGQRSRVTSISAGTTHSLIAAVPEPTSITLLFTGLVVTMFRLRRMPLAAASALFRTAEKRGKTSMAQTSLPIPSVGWET